MNDGPDLNTIQVRQLHTDPLDERCVDASPYPPSLDRAHARGLRRRAIGDEPHDAAARKAARSIDAIGIGSERRGDEGLEAPPHRAVPILPHHVERASARCRELDLDFDGAAAGERKVPVVREVELVPHRLERIEEGERIAAKRCRGVIRVRIAPRPHRDHLGESSHGQPDGLLGLEDQRLAPPRDLRADSGAFEYPRVAGRHDGGECHRGASGLRGQQLDAESIEERELILVRRLVDAIGERLEVAGVHLDDCRSRSLVRGTQPGHVRRQSPARLVDERVGPAGLEHRESRRAHGRVASSR